MVNAQTPTDARVAQSRSEPTFNGATSTDAPPSEVEVLPGGTSVTVSLKEPLSSSTAQVGDQLAIVVREPVFINGYLFIARGANGRATVTSAQHAGGNGSGGELAMTIDWVYAVDGGKIKLSRTDHSSRENTDTKGASSTATIAGYLLLGPLGLFAHNFIRGKDVTISTDKKFTAFVDHDVRLVAQLPQPQSEDAPR
jgi:hypothetical protein